MRDQNKASLEFEGLKEDLEIVGGELIAWMLQKQDIQMAVKIAKVFDHIEKIYRNSTALPITNVISHNISLVRP